MSKHVMIVDDSLATRNRLPRLLKSLEMTLNRMMDMSLESEAP